MFQVSKIFNGSKLHYFHFPKLYFSFGLFCSPVDIQYTPYSTVQSVHECMVMHASIIERQNWYEKRWNTPPPNMYLQMKIFMVKWQKKVSTLIPYPHSFPFCNRELQTISFCQHQQPNPTTIPIPTKPKTNHSHNDDGSQFSISQ